MIPDMLTIPRSEETRSEAVQTLIEHLGITKAALFLRDSMRQGVEVVRELRIYCGKRDDAQYLLTVNR